MSRRQPIRFLPVALLLPVALGAQTPARRDVHVPARRRLGAERDGKEERDGQEANRLASRHAFSGSDGRVFLTYWSPIATPSPIAPAPSASRVRSSGRANRSQSS